MRNQTQILLLILVAACSETHHQPGKAPHSPALGSDPADGSVPDAHLIERDGQAEGDVCALPSVTGDCDAYFPRWFHNTKTGHCEMFVYGGCGGNANNFDTQAACEAACVTTPAPEHCAIDASDASLPGVTLHVEAERCNFAVGQAGEFHWELKVDKPIAYQVEAAGGCGSCRDLDSPSPGELVTYRIGGDDVRYCECDVGCCPSDESMAHTLAAGTDSSTIKWPGRQWNGPSDTSEPLGAVFPAGSYDVSVELALPGVGKVVAKLPIKVE